MEMAKAPQPETPIDLDLHQANADRNKSIPYVNENRPPWLPSPEDNVTLSEETYSAEPSGIETGTLFQRGPDETPADRDAEYLADREAIGHPVVDTTTAYGTTIAGIHGKDPKKYTVYTDGTIEDKLGRPIAPKEASPWGPLRKPDSISAYIKKVTLNGARPIDFLMNLMLGHVADAKVNDRRLAAEFLYNVSQAQLTKNSVKVSTNIDASRKKEDGKAATATVTQEAQISDDDLRNVLDILKERKSKDTE